MSKKYALLIDYEYCTGCQSCMVACKNELGLSTEDEPWGIKVLQFGPWELNDGSWEFDYFPLPTNLCNLCIQRIERGEAPACVHHCLAQCMEYGTIEELAPRMAEMDGRAYIIQPKL